VNEQQSQQQASANPSRDDSSTEAAGSSSLKQKSDKFVKDVLNKLKPKDA
jgi:hypothetical protein